MPERGDNGHEKHNLKGTCTCVVTREQNLELEDLSSTTKVTSSCLVCPIRQQGITVKHMDSGDKQPGFISWL